MVHGTFLLMIFSKIGLKFWVFCNFLTAPPGGQLCKTKNVQRLILSGFGLWFIKFGWLVQKLWAKDWFFEFEDQESLSDLLRPITIEPLDQFWWIKDKIHLKLNGGHFLFYKVDRQVALSKICKKLRILKLFLKKSLIKMAHEVTFDPLKRSPRVRGIFWYPKGCWNVMGTCTFFEKTENSIFEKCRIMKLLKSANQY